MDDPAARRRAIADGLQTVRRRIDSACRAAGREPSEVTLVVVTKTYPAPDVVALAELGVRDVGENRDQEASAKRDEVEERAELEGRGGPSLRWHCVGQVQTNKAGSVARWADVVHSLDRPRLVTAMSRAAVQAGRRIDALVQVGLDDASGRGGCRPGDLPSLADAVAEAEGLQLRGVMAVAPLGADPAEAFDRLRSLAETLRERHPSADWISAGMSGDLEQAVAAGATHVRVGSAVLGRRPPLR